MMEENKNIFLADSDALIYWAGPMHKEYSTTFVWAHLFQLPHSFTYMYRFRLTLLLRIWFHRLGTLLSYFEFSRLLQFPHIPLPQKFKNWSFFVLDTHHFLVSYSVFCSLLRKVFSLMEPSNCQLFYLSWLLTKLSYANVKGELL